MAASRRSTRASTMKIAPTRAISDGVYGREEGVSIEQRCRCWVIRGKPSRAKIHFCPLWSKSGHSADGLAGLNLNCEPRTQRFQGDNFNPRHRLERIAFGGL